MRGQTRVINSKAAAMKEDCWDTPLALQNLAKAIPIISENRLPLLTGNNFQTPPPPLLFWAPFSHLLIFRLSVRPPLLLRLPIIWNWRVISSIKKSMVHICISYKFSQNLYNQFCWMISSNLLQLSFMMCRI